MQQIIKDSEISTYSSFSTSRHCLKKFCLFFTIIIIGIVIYGVKLLSDYIEFEIGVEITKHYLVRMDEFFADYWWILIIIVTTNLVLTLVIGRYILSAMLYPYQNSIIRETLDRSNATKFGEEFSNYLESMVYTIRILAGMDIESRKSTGGRQNSSFKKKASTPNDDSDDDYQYLTFTEMKNTIDLI